MDQDQEQRTRRRKRAAERRRREQELRTKITVLIICGCVLLLVLIWALTSFVRSKKEESSESSEPSWKDLVSEEELSLLSEDVLSYGETVYYYAKEEGIEEHEGVLLAIMQVETAGTGSDVMQSSESKGLRAGTLGPEESIEQACYYYAELLRIAEEHECDEKSVIQAYNYGPGYLLFVGENGGKHSQELAEQYAQQKSGGATVTYTHEIAEDNGSWMYKYGNMYYEALVAQYLP